MRRPQTLSLAAALALAAGAGSWWATRAYLGAQAAAEALPRGAEDLAQAERDLADLASRLTRLQGLGDGKPVRVVLTGFVDPWGHEYLADMGRGLVMHCGEDGYRGQSRPDEAPDRWVAFAPRVPAPADADLCPTRGADRASWLAGQGFTPRPPDGPQDVAGELTKDGPGDPAVSVSVVLIR